MYRCKRISSVGRSSPQPAREQRADVFSDISFEKILINYSLTLGHWGFLHHTHGQVINSGWSLHVGLFDVNVFVSESAPLLAVSQPRWDSNPLAPLLSDFVEGKKKRP